MRTTSRKFNKLVLLKISICIPLLVYIFLPPIAVNRTLEHNVNNCNCGPSTSWNPPGPHGTTKDSLRVKDTLSTKTTQPVFIENTHSTVWVNPIKNKNLYITIDSTLNVQVDSPEYETKFYANWDTMMAHGLRPNQMAPRPSFITTKKTVGIQNVERLNFGDYGAQSISVGSNLKYSLPKAINFHFDSSVYLIGLNLKKSTLAFNYYSSPKELSIAGCLFDETPLEVSWNKQTDISETKFLNAPISIQSKNIRFERSTFVNTNLNSYSNGSIHFTKCDFENFNINPGQGDLVLNDIEVNSNNKIQIAAHTELKNISGTGTMQLVSVYEIDEGLKKGIAEYAKKYGSTKSIRNEIRSAIVLNNVNLANLIFSPSEVFFIVDTLQDFVLQERAYTQLIEYFKNNDEERKMYDIQYRKLKVKYEDNWWSTLKDQCQEKWNNYGYENDHIWMITLNVLLFFYCFNFLFFPVIVKDGYKLEEFNLLYNKSKRYSLFKRFCFELTYSFLYSVLLFWIFNIDWSKLRVRNLYVAWWIVIQYITSILLLTFIAKSIFI